MADVTKYRMTEEALELLQDPDALGDVMAEGKTFKEIVGFSDEVMDDFYEVAAKLLEERRLEEAQNAFTFLTTMDPGVAIYWHGFGMANQWNGEIETALNAYRAAIDIDPLTVEPYFQAVGCLVEEGDVEQAAQIVATVFEYLHELEENDIEGLEELRETAETLKEYVNEQQS